MKKVLILSLLFVLVVSGSFARLTETLEQCIERYGPAKDGGDGNYFFNPAGFVIMISFYDGRSFMMKITRMTKSEISKADRDVLEDANGGGSKWITVIEEYGEYSKVTEDETKMVVYNRSLGTGWDLIFMTMNYVKNMDRIDEARAKQRLKGF